MTNRKRNNYEAFSLLEILVFLLIISILILLFVPNLSMQKEAINKKGTEAVVKLVETQIDLYELEKNKKPTVEQLLSEHYITQDQYNQYLEKDK